MVADVGARIRSLRTAKGLTQAQLAEPQYTKAYISMLESGRTRASMKALEHIAGVLGVKPADLLGGAPSPATPQFALLEGRRLTEVGRAREAIPMLEQLEEGLSAQDQLVRLRYLAVAYNSTGQPKQAFPLIERAQKMAELLGDAEEQVRLKSALAAAYMRTYAYEDAARLFRECVQACDDGVVIDPAFLFRRLVDLAIAQGNLRQSKLALATYERAIELSQQFDDRTSLAHLYAGMAKAYHDSGDLEAAIVYNQRSLQVYEDLGLLDQVACALDNAAALYVEHGNTTRAPRRAIGRRSQTRFDPRLDQGVAGRGAGEERSRGGARRSPVRAQVRTKGGPDRRAGARDGADRRAADEGQRRGRAAVLSGSSPARGGARTPAPSSDLRPLVSGGRSERGPRRSAAACAACIGDRAGLTRRLL